MSMLEATHDTTVDCHHVTGASAFFWLAFLVAHRKRRAWQPVFRNGSHGWRRNEFCKQALAPPSQIDHVSHGSHRFTCIARQVNWIRQTYPEDCPYNRWANCVVSQDKCENQWHSLRQWQHWAASSGIDFQVSQVEVPGTNVTYCTMPETT